VLVEEDEELRQDPLAIVLLDPLGQRGEVAVNNLREGRPIEAVFLGDRREVVDPEDVDTAWPRGSSAAAPMELRLTRYRIRLPGSKVWLTARSVSASISAWVS
jgi:hypothetical protein